MAFPALPSSTPRGVGGGGKAHNPSSWVEEMETCIRLVYSNLRGENGSLLPCLLHTDGLDLQELFTLLARMEIVDVR